MVDRLEGTKRSYSTRDEHVTDSLRHFGSLEIDKAESFGYSVLIRDDLIESQSAPSMPCTAASYFQACDRSISGEQTAQLRLRPVFSKVLHVYVCVTPAFLVPTRHACQCSKCVSSRLNVVVSLGKNPHRQWQSSFFLFFIFYYNCTCVKRYELFQRQARSSHTDSTNCTLKSNSSRVVASMRSNFVFRADKPQFCSHNVFRHRLLESILRKDCVSTSVIEVFP